MSIATAPAPGRRRPLFPGQPLRARRALATAAVAVLAALPALPAQALNVLLCNDDSVVAANLRALQHKLIGAGHQVIVTAPLDNHSGRGGSMEFVRPIPAVAGTERGAAPLGLAAGAASVGAVAGDSDVYYVNSTPVAACLYGLDVQARQRWGAAPDLVISGPNEGTNTGMVTVSSGTVNNLFYAVNRQLPAIAVSDSITTKVTWSGSLPATHRAFEVADIVLRIVDALVAARGRAGDRLLPLGMGLNVNIPPFDPGTGAALKFAFTRIGLETDYTPGFYERLSDSPLARQSLPNAPAVPGISLDVPGTVLPSGAVLPGDAAPQSEGRVLRSKVVTVSPVEGAPLARRAFEDAMKLKLNALQ